MFTSIWKKKDKEKRLWRLLPDCHKKLGFFNWYGKLRGFFKQTNDEIKEDYLNKKTVKTF